MASVPRPFWRYSALFSRVHPASVLARVKATRTVSPAVAFPLRSTSPICSLDSSEPSHTLKCGFVAEERSAPAYAARPITILSTLSGSSSVLITMLSSSPSPSPVVLSSERLTPSANLFEK